MKIGIDAHFVGLRHGGNEYVFENIIKAMAEKPDAREELYAFSLDSKAEGIFPEDRVTLAPLRRKSVYLQRALEIPALARKLDLDLVHVPFNFLPVGKCRKVIHIHDLAFLHLKDSFTFAERQRMTWMTAFCSRRADHVFTISEFSKRDIMEKYGIPDAKVTVTPLAVDMARFRILSEAEKKTFREKRKLDFPFLLFVGTLQPRKNVMTLLKAFRALIQEGESNVHLALVGRKGWIYEDLFRFIRESGIENRVHHYEDVDAKDLTAFYNSAHALVFPSIFEGFGLPILEAMACGCPVISADASAMPEVYGDAALTFAPMDADGLGDCLRQILGDSALRNDLIQKGFRNGSKFSWAHTAEIIRKVYRSL
ncbi:MAG: glycosyl transferase group 1 [Fibrobacteres bacterium]|nr:glycosyl transferase group 1 [Fibrobacterota bacterium]